jgi:Tfp pilus assembly protein PilF
VTYDELAEKVWGRHFVSPENVSQRVKLLRKDLGDDASEPRYIETVRSKGYRLIPSVQLSPTPAPPVARVRRDIAFVAVGAAAALAVALIAGYSLATRSASTSNQAAPRDVLFVPPGTAVAPRAIDDIQGTMSPQAAAIYARALTQLDPGSRQSALRDLDRALEFDKRFANAYALKALIYSSQLVDDGWEVDAEAVELGQRVEENAERALTLDERATHAYLARAAVHWFLWRWSDALRNYEQALRFGPNDVDTLRNFGQFLSWAGEHERAIELMNRAVTLRDTADLRWRLGVVLTQARRFEEARDELLAARDLAPATPWIEHWIGQVEAALGMHQQALATLRTGATSGAEQESPVIVANLLYSYSRIGRTEEVERLAEGLERAPTGRRVSPGTRALSHLALGDADEAYRSLQTVVERIERHEPDRGFVNLMTLKLNYQLNPILDEPRFVALRDRIGRLD